MSDTPRTDANEYQLLTNVRPAAVVNTDFARTLERELNEVNHNYKLLSVIAKASDELREQMKAEVQRLRNQFGTCSVCGYVAWSERPGSKVEDCEYCQLKAELNQAKTELDLARIHEERAEACYFREPVFCYIT
jgi:hypothetical protein